MPHIKTPSGIEWFYDCEGEGEEILFLHGWGVDRRIWRQQTKFFSRNYRVLAVDLPGHGQSGWEKISFLHMALDLVQILRALDFQAVNIVGSSLGGLLALKLCGNDVSRIKRLILVGASPKFAKSEEYPYGVDVAHIRKLNGQLVTAYPSIVNIFFRSLFTREERESRRFRWLQKFRQTDKVPMKQALSEYLDIFEQEDLRPVLDEVKLPLQFIYGAEDYLCPKILQDLLQQKFPQARFDFFAQCGHFPFLSKPHEFNTVVAEFLNKPSYTSEV